MDKKILVVEDDPATLRFMEYTLCQEGYQVLLANNGLEGLKKAQTECPDLIILDIMLPGLDGFDICEQLRRQPATAIIPVLMVSAKAHKEDRDTGLRMGADDYLTKPVDPSDILDKVRTLLAGVGKVTIEES